MRLAGAHGSQVDAWGPLLGLVQQHPLAWDADQLDHCDRIPQKFQSPFYLLIAGRMGDLYGWLVAVTAF
ncbi:hypothetical protein JCM19000A_33820 [Silvimonas sp. JCM 19000]